MPVVDHFFGSGEDHFSGRRLQDLGDSHLNLFTQVISPVFDDNHCAVVQVTDSLVLLFAFLNDADDQILSWQHD